MAAICIATLKADPIEKICMNEPFKVQKKVVMGRNDQFGSISLFISKTVMIEPF